MTLKLLYGRAGSGKTKYCLDEINNNLLNAQAETPLILLVPEHTVFKIEKELAQYKNLGAFSRAYVFGFRRFAQKILQETGGAITPHITELGKKLLLSKLLAQHGPKLKLLSTVQSQRNFTETLSKIIEEFKTYNLSYQEIVDSTNALPDSVLKDKLADLSLIYREFSQLMQGQYLDNEDCLRLVAEKLKDAPMTQNCQVWLDGFGRFNPQELNIIESLLQVSSSVTITLTIDGENLQSYRHDNDLFNMQYKTRSKLMALAENNHNKIIEESLTKQWRTNSETLQHIEKNLFKFPLQSISNATAIKIVEAANERVEIEGIAVDIIRLCREEGYQWRDITVLVRAKERYNNLIETIFKDYQIPFFSDNKRASLHHPLAEFLRSALEAIDGFKYEPLFRLFKTGFFEVELGEIDLLENYVLQFGIKGKKWFETWSYYKRLSLDEDDELGEAQLASLEKINDIRQKVITPLQGFETKFKQALNVKEQTVALYELLETLTIPEKLSQLSVEAQMNKDLALAKEHKQIWDNIVELLEQLVAICGGEKFSLDQYYDILNDGIDNLKLSLIPVGLDYVTVADFEQNSNQNVAAVYIVGVNESLIPKKAGSEGLLSDAERMKMAELGLTIGGGITAENYEEWFKIYTAFTIGKKYLWVSYALANSEGAGLKPSLLIHSLKQMFKLKNILSLPLELPFGEEKVMLAVKRQAISKLANALRNYKSNGQLAPLWQDVYNFVLQEEPKLLSKTLAGLFHTRTDLKLSGKLAQKLYTIDKKLIGSVTRFEKFRACPFQHFAQYGLKLKERQQFSFSAPDLGQFIHATLKLFGEKLRQDKLDWGLVSAEEAQIICDNIIKELAPKLQSEILLSSNQYQYLLQRIKKTIIKSIYRLINFAQVSEFKPVGFEKSFGLGQHDLKPLVYPLENGYTLEITGQIDRIDALDYEGRKYLLIIDYKTGNAYINLSEVYHGLKLQLLTYLLVAQNSAQLLVGEEALPAGILYYFLKNVQVTANNKLGEGEVLAEIDKKLKMPGWVLADKELLKKMDADFKFIKVGLKVDGEINANSLPYVKTSQEFTALLQHINNTLQDIGSEILSGTVAVSPYKLGHNVACTYCKYKAICQFDEMLKLYEYNNLSSVDSIELPILSGGEQ